MTLPHYPEVSAGSLAYLRGVGWVQKWTPVFFNQSVKTVTGASIDIGLAATPLYNFELTYQFLKDAPSSGSYVAANYEFRRLFGFYAMMGGSRGRFVYQNTDDNAVTDQALGQGNGSQTTFPIVRSMGDLSASMFSTEPIGLLDDNFGAPTVKLNGTTTVAYTITSAPAASAIVFSSPPAGGVNVTITMRYVYYCRFVEDSIEFDKFADGWWNTLSVKLQSCRPGA